MFPSFYLRSSSTPLRIPSWLICRRLLHAKSHKGPSSVSHKHARTRQHAGSLSFDAAAGRMQSAPPPARAGNAGQGRRSMQLGRAHRLGAFAYEGLKCGNGDCSLHMQKKYMTVLSKQAVRYARPRVTSASKTAKTGACRH